MEAELALCKVIGNEKANFPSLAYVQAVEGDNEEPVASIFRFRILVTIVTLGLYGNLCLAKVYTAILIN